MRGFLIFVFTLLLIIFPQTSLAATFSLSPNQGSLTPGSTTNVEIRLTSSEPVNVFSAVINYPADLVDISWVNTGSLGFDISVEQSINNGQIRLSKGALTPISGSDIKLATLGIIAKSGGRNVSFNYSNASAIMSSTEAKNILDFAASQAANFSVGSLGSDASTQTNTTSSGSITNSPVPATSDKPDTKCDQVTPLKSKLIDKYKNISKIIVRLDTISTLIDNYHQTKLIPQNLQLADYSTYQDQTKTIRQAALVKLSSMQDNVVDVTCKNAENKVRGFKVLVKELKKDLINYRQANTDLLSKLQRI